MCVCGGGVGGNYNDKRPAEKPEETVNTHSREEKVGQIMFSLNESFMLNLSSLNGSFTQVSSVLSSEVSSNKKNSSPQINHLLEEVGKLLIRRYIAALSIICFSSLRSNYFISF